MRPLKEAIAPYENSRPSVEVRVLPLRAEWHAGLDGAFTVFEMPEPYPEVAYVESLAGRLYLETPDAERFVRAYDRLREVALGPEESAELIAAAKELK